MAGLQDIWPKVSMFCVTKSVLAPARAEAAAASPAGVAASYYNDIEIFHVAVIPLAWHTSKRLIFDCSESPWPQSTLMELVLGLWKSLFQRTGLKRLINPSNTTIDNGVRSHPVSGPAIASGIKARF